MVTSKRSYQISEQITRKLGIIKPEVCARLPVIFILLINAIQHHSDSAF